MKPVNIQYPVDTPEEMSNNLEKAKQDYDRLITEGHPCVRIVVSRHPYSEGVWVEAGDNFTALSNLDTVYKTNNMGYMTDGLTFNVLRDANINRLPTFKNAKGLPAHSHPEGRDWSPAQWLQAVTGELGEYANIRKKFERGDIEEAEFKERAAKELADVVTYLDILAFQVGINLGQAVVNKFNEVSARIGSPVIMNGNGTDWHLLK